jgi:cytochrome c peroxidase
MRISRVRLTGRRLRAGAAAAAFLALTAGAVNRTMSAGGTQRNPLPSPDPTGTLSTYTTNDFIDFTNPFFQNLGTNGRTCGTCHVSTDGWTVTPPHIQARFNSTSGLDPIFRTNDGSNCDDLDVSTVAARQSAYSLLLNKGLIRISLPVPAGAQFSVTGVNTPYTPTPGGAGDCTSTTTLSMYRRPLPSTNLGFLSAVMWDGRETIAAIPSGSGPGSAALQQDLAHQSNDATMGHAQGAALTTDQQNQIVAFELALSTAQSQDNAAGNLQSQGAQGGPINLSTQPFYIGINDPLGKNPNNIPFNSVAFTSFSAWENLSGGSPNTAARQSVGRGEILFNTRTINITNVGGLNATPTDPLGQNPFNGTCTTCHDTPNVGNHSVSAPLNIGISDASRRTADMPLYTLFNSGNPECVTNPGDPNCTVQTMDPGRAMITGMWNDIGKVKGPVLRGLAGRAPYFHNGSAATLMDAVNFYDTRFGIGFTNQEKTDLVNFLNTL